LYRATPVRNSGLPTDVVLRRDALVNFNEC
jgi:hypothetical protein